MTLWSEWKPRRVDLKDKEGWERFLRHAESELDDIVPWLENHTRPTDNDRRLLLFIGRDCLRRMLRQPRQIGTSEERQLEALLAQARELYEPAASPKPRAAFVGAGSVPPKNTGPPAHDQRSFRSR